MTLPNKNIPIGIKNNVKLVLKLSKCVSGMVAIIITVVVTC